MPEAMIFSAIILSALVLLAGWLDWKHRLLPNWLALTILLVAIVSVIAFSGFDALAIHLAHFAIALVIGLALFAIGWVGGGDAKTYAAVAAAVPLYEGHVLLLSTAAALFVIVLVWFAISAFRRISMRRADKQDGRDIDEKYTKVPLGVAIAFGTIGYLWLIDGVGSGWWGA